MHIRWLRTALANLDAEAEYIAADNPAAAGRVVQKVLRAVNLLKRNPALGRAGRVVGTREMVVAETPYIIPYRVRGDAVEILWVFHPAEVAGDVLVADKRVGKECHLPSKRRW